MDIVLEQSKHQSKIGGILNVQMQDSDSDDSDYRDPMSNDHDEAGLSSGGVANKQMDDVAPTIEMLAKQAQPLVSI